MLEAFSKAQKKKKGISQRGSFYLTQSNCFCFNELRKSVAVLTAVFVFF